MARNIITVLKYKIILNGMLEMKVKGNSMRPAIMEDDIIKIQHADEYKIGEILVFCLENNVWNVHRLLKKESDYFLCKGDNSFPLEVVTADRLLGKVVEINGRKCSGCDKELIEESYNIHKIYIANGYNKQKTKESYEYQSYYNTYITKK